MSDWRVDLEFRRIAEALERLVRGQERLERELKRLIPQTYPALKAIVVKENP